MRITVNTNNFKQAIKNHCVFTLKKGLSDSFKGIHFKVVKNKLILTSLDGIRLLVSEIEINNPKPTLCFDILVRGNDLKFLKFGKQKTLDLIFYGTIKPGSEDILKKLSIKTDTLEYIFPDMELTLPETKKIIPDLKNHKKISLNNNFLKEVAGAAAVNKRTSKLDMYCTKSESYLALEEQINYFIQSHPENKKTKKAAELFLKRLNSEYDKEFIKKQDESNLQPVIFVAENNEGMKTTAVLMPIEEV